MSGESRSTSGAEAPLALGEIESEVSSQKIFVSPDVLEDLVFYFKYASSAYHLGECARPNGQTLVKTFNSEYTQSKGYIARDDDRKELVLALRGSASVEDLLTDSWIILVPFVSEGVSPPDGVKVHAGFLEAWNSLLPKLLSPLIHQLELHPDYTLVTTGHSLGGALASIGGAFLDAYFVRSKVRMYTYGQPRTGNWAYAKWVNEAFGPDAFRSVHTNDGVPTIIPRTIGYHHHGIEYWQFLEGPPSLTTRQCSSHGEDILCSGSVVPSEGINGAHLVYFGIPAGTPYCG